MKQVLKEYNESILPKIFQAIKDSRDELTGVHFSNGVITGKDKFKGLITVPHLGMNKAPAHRDPIGVYVFPKKYVLSGGLKNNSGFAAATYFYIIEPNRTNAKILNLSTLSQNELEELVKKMEIPESYLTDKEVYHNSGNKPGHKLWGIMEKFRKDTNQGSYGNSYSWNKLFKKTGYNVIQDDGDAIIHSNEPNQIIYLEPNTYNVIESGEEGKEPRIFTDVIKAFPQFIPKKKKASHSFGDNKDLSLLDPEHRSFQIVLQYYTRAPSLLLRILGRRDNKDGTVNDFTRRFSDSSHDDGKLSSEIVIDTIKNFLENSIKYSPSYLSKGQELAEDEELCKKVAETYGFKFDTKHTLIIQRKYFDKSTDMKVVMNIRFGRSITMDIERHRHYSIDNFYFGGQVEMEAYDNEPVSKLIEDLITKIEVAIEKDTYSKNWNKEAAKKFLSLLRKRVFVPRKA